MKFEMSEIKHFVLSCVASEHVPPLKSAFLTIVSCFRAGTCSENTWTLNVVHMFLSARVVPLRKAIKKLIALMLMRYDLNNIISQKVIKVPERLQI